MALRLLLDPFLGDRLVLATLYGAIAVSVWYGGYGPAAVSVVLGYIACNVLFINPRGSFALADAGSVIGMGLYLLSALLIVVIGHRMRVAGERLRASLALLGEEAAERRAAQDKVNALLQRLTALVDNTPLAVVEWDKDFAITRWSGLAERVFGWPAEEVLGKPIDAIPLVHPGDAARVRETMARLQDAANTFVVSRNRNTTKDGRVISCEWYNSVIHDESGALVAVLSMVLDVTGRERAALDLRASEDRYRAFIAHSSEGIWRMEFDPPQDTSLPVDEQVERAYRFGRYAECNDAMARMYGLERAQDLVGKSLDFMLPPTDPAAREFIASVIRHGYRVTDVESCETDAHGRPVYFANSMIGVVEDGKLRGMWGIQRDITEQRLAEERLIEHRDHLDRLVRERTAELERSHEALRLAERMAAMGTLSAGLGHDMNNILLPMRVWLDALDHSSIPADARDSVRSLHRSTDYLRSLALGLRALSMDPEDDAGAPVRTVLAEWWPEVQGLYHAPLPRGIHLHGGGFEGLPHLAIPAHSLTQAVFNLVQNAGDALRDRAQGDIWITAEPEPGVVRLCVRDNGPGMAPEVRARCVEPFFTTKPRGCGTGLGLSIVHGILKRYGGHLEVESEPGRGSTFTLVLAAAAAETEPSGAAAVSVRDARTQAFVRAIVTRLGMTVAPYTNGTPPDAGFWVADDSVTTEVLRRFLESGGQAVVLGERPGLAGRVEFVPDPRNPSSVRDAITRAAGPAAAR